MTDDEIRALWRASGGGQFGPHTETMEIPESKFYDFCHALIIMENTRLQDQLPRLDAAEAEVKRLQDQHYRLVLETGKKFAALTERGEGMALVPVEPTLGLLMSMALRYDHALGFPKYYDQPFLAGPNKPTHAQRLESALTTMRQIHEEVVGAGFYHPEREAEYVVMMQRAGQE